MNNQIVKDDKLDIASDKPLVTFALFAYNQENFVREAIEGAFAQTYEPLEIILSDDCSTDRTFEIIQEMAKAYCGPHRVVARCNAFNLMTALHVQTVANKMNGALLVVAAGDDISAPNRVERLVDVWVAAGQFAGAIHSGWDTFRGDDGGHIGRRKAKHPRYPNMVIRGYAHADWLPAAAPTVAYTTEVFRDFRPLPGGSIIEDAPLLMRAALIGRLVSCDDPLVRVRVHDENTGTGYTFARPANWNRFMQSKIVAFRTMQSDLAQQGTALDPALRRVIERQILSVLQTASPLIMPQYYELSIFARIRLAALMVMAPAINPRLRVRVEFMLRFFGFVFHDRLRVKVVHMLNRNRTIEAESAH